MKEIINYRFLFLGILALILFSPSTVLAVKLLTPEQGVSLPSGSIFTISWAASPKDVYCKLE